MTSIDALTFIKLLMTDDGTFHLDAVVQLEHNWLLYRFRDLHQDKGTVER